MSGTHTDISERKQYELARREASIVFDNSYEGIAVTDPAGHISKVNPAFTRITGYAEAEVAGRNPKILSSGRHDSSFYAELWTSLNERDFWQGEIWNRRKSGELYATLQSISVVRDENNRVQHFVSVFADISQLKAHQAELDRVANFDSLTGLPNRRLLTDRLQQSLLRARRSGKLSAVCLLDLDGFKAINDSYGHAVGDQVLVGIAAQLKTTLRAQDTLARMGGDEFVLLLNDLGTVDDCTHILDRVLQALRQPVQADGHLLRSSASIGVSLYPADDADPDTLLRHADQAMYLAKQVGKNRYQMFDLDIDRRTQVRRDGLGELRLALERNEFVLHYQPKVDLVSGEVTGAEALIRWQHPERGLLAPGAFLHHVSGSELEKPLGEWVLDSAMGQIATWARQGLTIKVSVNISADHLLKPDFCDRLALALSLHSAVDPAHLELEMLETAAIEDMEQAVDILRRCMALGVVFSLDDFGTGYSSLTYLRKLPVHTLKIDQSFVRNMLSNAEDLGIVKGVIELANVFHREVIAEGVETLEHGAVLRRMGCRQVQGYGIARPMPAARLPEWQIEWQKARIWLTLEDELPSLRVGT
jgi:diguanylate cyclase (GGDEF)-like protein/PAS domain S-box-containing protein